MAWFNDDVELTAFTDKIATTLKYWHKGDVIVELSMCKGHVALETWKSLDIKEKRDAILDAMTHAKAVIRAYEKSGNWSDAWLVMPPVHGIGIDRNVSSERGFIDETYSINGNRACMVILKNSNGGSYVSTYQFGEHDYEEIALIHMFAKKRIEAHEKALEEKKQAEEKKRAEEDRVRSIVTEEREAFLTDLLRRMGYRWQHDSKWEVRTVGLGVWRDIAGMGLPEGYVNCTNGEWGMYLRLKSNELPQYIAAGVWGVVNE